MSFDNGARGCPAAAHVNRDAIAQARRSLRAEAATSAQGDRRPGGVESDTLSGRLGSALSSLLAAVIAAFIEGLALYAASMGHGLAFTGEPAPGDEAPPTGRGPVPGGETRVKPSAHPVRH